MGRQFRTVVSLAAALGVAFALTRFGAPPKAALQTRLVYEAVWWAVAAAIAPYFLSLARQMPSWRDIAIAVAAGALIALGKMLVYLTLFPVLLLSISLSHVPNILEMPSWYRLLMVMRIAVAGELLFRAYPIERGEAFAPGSGKWIAAAASFAVFAAASWSGWNPVEGIATIFAGAMFTGLYLWRHSLAVNALASFIALSAGYLLR
ncbi:MAG TPA: CPBP family glutamic-type intramembrane protease [Rhizomicrobium sp.]|nr:CPBP family glutamic-type intramembrane protease [Rhizomicrobium sp.]